MMRFLSPRLAASASAPAPPAALWGGGTAAAEHHGPLISPAFAAAEGCQKPLHIRVGAAPAILSIWDERVDCLKPTGSGTELAAKAGHSLFVGNGHIEAMAAHRPEPLHHLRESVLLTGQCQVPPVELRLQRPADRQYVMGKWC